MPAIKIRLVFLCLIIPLVSLYPQDSLRTVIARKGDGIYSLLRKEGLNPYEGYHEFIALNLENLRDSLHLYEGISYKIPALSTSADTLAKNGATTTVFVPKKPVKGVTYPIFGPAYELVEPKSDRLSGTVFYLISGHGGPDPGAMTDNVGQFISEDEYAYDVTLRLARELLSHGAMVYVIVQDENDGIRDERILRMDRDEVVYPNETIPLNQLARLRQRVEVVNDLYRENKGKYQRLIVTHVDSRSRGQNIDVFFYYHENSSNGKNLAASIHKTFQEKYRKYQPNRIYTGTFEDRSNLYLVKKTHPAMTYIEIGNIRSTKDQRRILDPDNRQALAKWIAEGALLDYEK